MKIEDSALPAATTIKETEDLLAEKLNKLAVKERSKALNDVHCVGARCAVATRVATAAKRAP